MSMDRWGKLSVNLVCYVSALMDTKSTDTAKLVKTLRERLEISQDSLARGIGSTVKSVSRWESGHRIAGKYLAELATLSNECGLDDAANEFTRLRQEEIAKSVSDNRSTRRIPTWELQNI